MRAIPGDKVVAFRRRVDWEEPKRAMFEAHRRDVAALPLGGPGGQWAELAVAAAVVIMALGCTMAAFVLSLVEA